ncbi:MAG: UDP-N-acetylmuramoyl-tripeptide--D-alanyl-D-alanine ligase [Thermodesulfobacteriota bacterium]
MELKVSEIAEALKRAGRGGRLIRGGDAVAGGVVTDSRKECRGAVFFALRGPNFDGHRFIADAFARGAVAAVVDEKGAAAQPACAAIIEVDDTLSALGSLAAFVRRGFAGPVVAVSGSAGKTTTKDMTASILGRSRKVLKTEGNRNNLIGLPLTLFGLDGSHGAAVVELGISEPGEMERLAAIARPDVALITNIGRGHLEGLGSLEGVARAKAPLFGCLEEKGVMVVNLDDPWVVSIAGTMRNAVTYSLKGAADVRVRRCTEAGLAGTTVTYVVRGRDVTVRLSAPGLVNVMNGVAAIAASLPLGAGEKDVEEGLGSFVPAKGRMEVIRAGGAGGVAVLDDTYNANPESVAAALDTLRKAGGRKVAVLGDMLELGPSSRDEHREAGRLAGTLGIEVVVAVGSYAADLLEGAASAGAREVYGFNSREEAAAALGGLIKRGDTVLVKGSRAVGLEYITDWLKTEFEKA